MKGKLKPINGNGVIKISIINPVMEITLIIHYQTHNGNSMIKIFIINPVMKITYFHYQTHNGNSLIKISIINPVLMEISYFDN